MHTTTSIVLWSWVSHVVATNFLNHAQLLSNIENADWFDRNIPILDIPDKQIQEIYYYRWQSFKEHLVYTGAQYGYMSSEFLHPAGYGAPYGGIVAAAGHHIMESRWIRDLKFGQDLVNYWLAGPGQLPKPATEGLNKDTFDWAHQYSFWAASSVWKQYQVTGDRAFVVGQLDNLVKQYRGWDSHFNNDLGLYWQVPVWDATEFTPASYESSDAYHGGAGFRPTINAYQYGDARAIASIAALKGNQALADEYNKRANDLRDNMHKRLWDSNLKFYMHRHRDNNPSGTLLTSREIMGYIPWMFNMPDVEATSAAFAQLKDDQGFSAKYGPTTAERRSKWFMFEAGGCCHWNGPSWPFATSQTLTAVENLLHDYPAQSYITSADYFTFLKRYAATQYKEGKPHVAEAHHPDNDNWIYDGVDHSEDYNHSTYLDNVLAGLMGLRAQADDSLVVNPLAPSTWDHFAVENAPYHGHTITVLWDSTGSFYGQGKGLRVYVNGSLAGSRATLGLLKVQVGAANPPAASQMVNIAANGQNFPQLTTAFASYTFGVDNVQRVIDGMVWRTGIPPNSRWTSYSSPNAEDHVGVNFRRNQAVCEARIFFYDDGGGVRLPSKYDLQYWTGNSWATVPGQQRSPLAIMTGSEKRITFPTLTTSQLRVVAPNPGSGKGWGLSEFEVWSAPIIHIRNENSAKLMGVENKSTANGANIQQYEDNGTRDHLWQVVPAAGGWKKLKNLNSGLLLAVQNASKDNSARLQQYQDNGTDDHLWRLESKGGGLFFIRNKNSNKLAAVDQMSTANSANIVQFEDNNTNDHLWSLLPAVSEGCSAGKRRSVGWEG